MENAAAPVSLFAALEGLFDAALERVAVAIPGVVESYANGTATVRPGVRRLTVDLLDPEGQVTEDLPAIPDVPVCWPRGRNFQIVGTLSAGDPVLLVCCDRDVASWRASGAVSDPLDARHHDWSHAVAIPGLVPDVASFPVPGDAAALASVVLDELTTLRDAVDALQTAFIAHTHVTVPASAVEPPVHTLVPVPSPGSMASSVLKVSG